ncbi:MAG: T9SS type A sorting domain-containing protein [Chlorobiota bacterium]
MKRLIILLILTANMLAFAEEPEYLWFKWTDSNIQNVDFTLDDEFIIVWNDNLEFWGVTSSEREFFLPTESAGDYNYNYSHLLFSQDSTPKLLDWQSRETIDGFKKEEYKIGKIRTAKSKNEFMAQSVQDSNVFFFWNIDEMKKVDSLTIPTVFKKNNNIWKRKIWDYDYAGDNDEFLYLVLSDNNNIIEPVYPPYQFQDFFVHIYNLDTDKQVDSVYLFTNSRNHYGGLMKLITLDDRNIIAMNIKQGFISYYDVETNRFIDEYRYTQSTGEINDIEFLDNGEKLAIADGGFFKIVDLEKNEILQEYNYGIELVKLSYNSDIFTLGGREALTLRRKSWVMSSVENKGLIFILSLSPNPADSRISINFGAEIGSSYGLSLIDLSGNEVGRIDSGIIDTEQYTIDYDISQLPAGVYFVRLELAGKVITRKFVKE